MKKTSWFFAHLSFPGLFFWIGNFIFFSTCSLIRSKRVDKFGFNWLFVLWIPFLLKANSRAQTRTSNIRNSKTTWNPNAFVKLAIYRACHGFRLKTVKWLKKWLFCNKLDCLVLRKLIIYVSNVSNLIIVKLQKQMCKFYRIVSRGEW